MHFSVQIHWALFIFTLGCCLEVFFFGTFTASVLNWFFIHFCFAANLFAFFVFVCSESEKKNNINIYFLVLCFSCDMFFFVCFLRSDVSCRLSGDDTRAQLAVNDGLSGSY